MIAQKARATYAKLPTSERSATSVLDLIEDGKIVAITRAAKMWSPKREVKFSTYLFACLDNYYKDVLRAAYSEQRFAHVLSADTTVMVGNVSGRQQYLSDYLKRSRKDRIEDRLIARIDAERGFVRAYAAADHMLRKYLIRWLLQPEDSKLKTGKDFFVAVTDFERLGAQHLTIDMCRAIHSDFECRVAIANNIVSRFVTPRKGFKVATKMSETREYAVLPLLSAERQKSVMALV